MRSIAGVGIGAGLGLGSTTASASTATGTEILGTFEDGLDGWKTNGGVTLSRVSSDEDPHVVAQGDHALLVESGGDGYPVVENKAKVDGSNYVETPYLVGRVFVGQSAAYEKLTLVLRYHHQATPAANGKKDDKKKGRKGNRKAGKSALVEETTQTVPVGGGSTFSWDLSQLSDEKLATPQRLSIGWYLGETPPKNGPNGKQGKSESAPGVVLDAIRMTDDFQALEEASLINYLDGYVADRGYYSYEFREYFEGGERGAFVFLDGSEISYRWEEVGPERETVTIDGRTFKIGGGWR